MFTGDTALVKCEKKFKFPSNITHSNGSHALIQCGMHTRRTWLPDFRTRLPDCEYVSIYILFCAWCKAYNVSYSVLRYDNSHEVIRRTKLVGYDVTRVM